MYYGQVAGIPFYKSDCERFIVDIQDTFPEKGATPWRVISVCLRRSQSSLFCFMLTTIPQYLKLCISATKGCLSVQMNSWMVWPAGSLTPGQMLLFTAVLQSWLCSVLFGTLHSHHIRSFTRGLINGMPLILKSVLVFINYMFYLSRKHKFYSGLRQRFLWLLLDVSKQCSLCSNSTFYKVTEKSNF